jgi:protein-S-isoprenylcysteine O-methyltransferase Ste14
MPDTVAESQNAGGNDHSTRWWWLKVLCGVGLIIGVAVRFVADTSITNWYFPVFLAQLTVVIGGVLYIWHYLLLKRKVATSSAQAHLVTAGGLNKFIRHPMYFSDALYYLGLALLWPSIASSVILVVGWFALRKQAMTEDEWCARRFAEMHQAWHTRTKLIVPFLY